VAYKNTREARVALAAAVPLLGEASRVLVVGVGPDIRPDDLADAVGYLGCHGVFAEPHRVPDGNDLGAAEVLMAIADQEDADCIVCGGYGHGRARELVFGGVTRELLSRARRPCLFAH
jgi:nucleotide-binding universal stress UspA family protein